MDRQAPLVAAVASIWSLWALATAGPAVANTAYHVADPGGNEHASVPVPPPGGRYFGFSEQSYGSSLDGWSASDVATVGQGAGANAQRVNVDWWAVEPQRDQWDEAAWSHYDSMYRALVSRGMKPLLTIGFAPPWARAGLLAQTCTSRAYCAYPPARDMDGEWAQFAAEVARRFPKAAIEIWNEPNMQFFWKPSPDPARYAELVTAAYRAIKQVNPDTPVVAGSLAPAQSLAPAGNLTMWPLRSFLQAAYDAKPSIKHHMDAVSFHVVVQALRYGRNTIFAQVFHELRSVTRSHGNAGIPLWITEDGLSTTGTGEHDGSLLDILSPHGAIAFSQAQQADGLLRQYKRVMTMPDVQTFIVHTLIDRYEVSANDVNRGFGTIISWDPFVPKLSYCAFARRADLSHPYGGCPKQGGGGPGNVYVRDSTKRYKIRPSRLQFVFGAGTFVKFTRLKPWHQWRHARTHASGIEHYNNCKPSCAQGHIRRTHSRVRLSHIHICHHRRVYGRIDVSSRKAPGGRGRITCAGTVLPRR
jgi:hypothetical protein